MDQLMPGHLFVAVVKEFLLRSACLRESNCCCFFLRFTCWRWELFQKVFSPPRDWLLGLFLRSWVPGNWRRHLGPHSVSGSGCPARLLSGGASRPRGGGVITVTLLESHKGLMGGRSQEVDTDLPIANIQGACAMPGLIAGTSEG